MGYSIGYDENWKRDIGYGVPAICDHPGCGKAIDRGLSYVCGGMGGGQYGCGLFFCEEHLYYGIVDASESLCERCCDAAMAKSLLTQRLIQWNGCGIS